ncbi:unnamed protein product [Didymodactylos carnosus]|uniref:RING-type domain-containing protein n=1 Tax=Didymodactylos carnosus TaxID=1234261 RepID=A0A813P2J0_9BILA|nr:unnamed protein product [Didymodactylos carnosus]CAF0783379.1 unnamed protein product [Didymodactylos carnosus]CAF3523081.1 unnamed protein product [Didymodactylos carnosus]CAF3565226.1 unnamed protein product [Didymodactylos carnosus]
MTSSDIDIQKLLECSICCDYLQEVRETPCCHILLCHSCLTSWCKSSGSNASCPGCRTILSTNQCKENIPIQRFVDSMPFDCPYKIDGCSARIPRSELEKHKKLCEHHPTNLKNAQKTKLTKLNQTRDMLAKRYDEYKSMKQQKQKQTVRKPLATELYDLAKKFRIECEYKLAQKSIQECLDVMGNDKELEELNMNAKIEAATIEKFLGQYDKSLQLYADALMLAKTKVELKQTVVELQMEQGHIYVKMGKYNAANQAYENALTTTNEFDDRQTNKILDKAQILNAMGIVAKKCSEYDKAIKAYTEAMNIVDEQSSLWSEIVSNLADVHRKKGSYKEARDLYVHSLKQMEALHGSSHPQIADIYNNLAMLAKKEGKYLEALGYLKTALKIGKHFYGAQHPSIGMYLTNMGDIYRKQGDYTKAEVIYKEAISTLEKALGRDHVEVAEVLNSMGLVLKKRADYAGAEELYKRAISIIQLTFGNQEHYKLGIYLNNLGDLDRKRNRFDSALSTYERALKSIEKTLGAEHSEAAEIMHNIGLVKHQLGDYSEACKLYESAMAIIKQEFGDKHYKYGMYINSMGLSLAMMDDYSRAYDAMKQSLQILLQTLGRDHIEVCDVYASLGDVCMKLVAEGKEKEKQTKLDEAKKYYTESLRIVQGTFGEEHTKTRQFQSLLYIVDNYMELAFMGTG